MDEAEPHVPTVGMVGGGQLARMTHAAATALGIGFRVLATDEREAAARVAAAVEIGHHTSLDDLQRFAKSVDVVTFDHEHVPEEHLRVLIESGVAVRPGPDALRHAQDKAVMRRRLTDAGLPCPAWRQVSTRAEIVAFAEEFGWPVVLKAARGGYDGRGVWVVEAESDLGDLLPYLTGLPLLVEQRVEFVRELSALVARSPHGQAAAYPVVETVQRDGMCVEVLAPAPNLPEEHATTAQQLALQISAELGVTGLLAVELFETFDGVLVNELAMRPHNSGHWTIEGAVTSQFEQHLRAVLDLPLGSARMVAPNVVMANVIGGPDPDDRDVFSRMEHVLAHDPEAKVHLYGKAVRPGRKIGHVTLVGDDIPDLRGRAQHAAEHLRSGSYV